MCSGDLYHYLQLQDGKSQNDGSLTLMAQQIYNNCQSRVTTVEVVRLGYQTIEFHFPDQCLTTV